MRRIMKINWLLLSFIPLLWATVALAIQPSFDGEDRAQILQEMKTLSSDGTVERLVNSNPGKYFLYVESLWNQGKKDDAVMWFYVARLRFRFHLLAHPDLDPSDDPALYVTVNRNFGPAIAQYAAQDPKAWAAQIAAALNWDATHDNGYTSKTDFKQALDHDRADMTKLGEYVLGNQVSLAAERKVGGMGDVDFVDGVLIDNHKTNKPAYIPALALQTTLDTLAGSYQDVTAGPLGRYLFGKEQNKVRRASVFKLSKQDDGSLLVVAEADGKEVRRRVIPVNVQGDAVTFEDDQTAKDIAVTLGLPTDVDTLTFYLRNDVSGDLIIDMEYLREGTYPGKKTHMRVLESYWYLAKRAATS